MSLCRPILVGGRSKSQREKFVVEGSRKNVVLSSKFSFLMTFFSHPSKIGNRKNTQQKCHRRRAIKLSAAAGRRVRRRALIISTYYAKKPTVKIRKAMNFSI